jgi:8-oxo-dGTP pyrophosphatase MutT (NUDIX family)
LYIASTPTPAKMSTHHPHIEWLRQRLREPLPGRSAQERMMGRVVASPPTVPDNARLSAVLCLLFPVDDRLHLLLMKRREDRTAHSGQVSFPGGRHEPEDPDLLTTALREAHEEVGIAPADVTVIGALTPLYIPVSNFNVFPYIGYMPSRPAYVLSDNEVSYTIEVPLDDLLHPERKIITDVYSPATPLKIKNVHAYNLQDGTIIWGATAMIISELEVALAEMGIDTM